MRSFSFFERSLFIIGKSTSVLGATQAKPRTKAERGGSKRGNRKNKKEGSALSFTLSAMLPFFVRTHWKHCGQVRCEPYVSTTLCWSTSSYFLNAGTEHIWHGSVNLEVEGCEFGSCQQKGGVFSTTCLILCHNYLTTVRQQINGFYVFGGLNIYSILSVSQAQQ